MAKSENVKVAIRVRPFNDNELKANSKNIVQIQNNQVSVTSKEGKQTPFTFDFCFWSHDGFKTQPDGGTVADPSHPNGSKYADQQKVYDSMGTELLNNAHDGYNSTILAYGQTGSGKSYSIIGSNKNPGIVPRICEAIFQLIAKKKTSEPQSSSELCVSMVEIYNEVPKDLLCNNNTLKIRESPGNGFYAAGVNTFPVTSYEEMSNIMEQGNLARTIHATKMNQTSSRAHTIVIIKWTQKSKSGDIAMAKTSLIYLVDLAGSERVSKSEATGSRLKEGACINQSLTTLGLCIFALANGNSQVPFRNSSLTKLLANCLGGNCKTMMIAAISPSDWNRDETISTLNYANSAKRMKTKPIVNENPVDKLIKDLQTQNEELRRKLEQCNGANALAVGNASSKDMEELNKKHQEEIEALMAENKNKMDDLEATYEQKLIQAQNGRKNSLVAGMDLDKINLDRKSKPHFTNLNPDRQLSGRIVYICVPGVNKVGNQKNPNANIQIVGSSILAEHATVTYTDKDEICLEPCSSEARVLHNGTQVTKKCYLHHNDRVLFGPTALYLFCHPKERDQSKTPYPMIDFHFAQAEIARTCGVVLPTAEGSQNLDCVMLQEELLCIMPAIQEANSISGELDKRVKFEIVLVVVSDSLNPECQKQEINVKMKNLENGEEFIWNKEKFLSRLSMMKEMYANYEEHDTYDCNQYEDPFQEHPDTEVEIGHCQIHTQPLAYLLETKDEYELMDYNRHEIGTISVEIDPCTPDGVEFSPSENKFVEKPEELIGRDLHFLVRIHSVRGVPNRYKAIQCRYKFYDDKEETVTGVADDPANAKINHRRIYSVKCATKEFVNYLHDGFFVINVFGKQQPRKSAMAFARGKSTREMLTHDREIFVRAKFLIGGFNMNGRVIDPNKQSCVVELLLTKKQLACLQQRMDGCRKLVEKAQKFGYKAIPVTMVRDVINAHNSTVVDKAISHLEGGVIPEETNHCGKHNNNNRVHTSSTCHIL